MTTVSNDSMAKVPLSKIPLMDLPLKLVAVDLIGPIMPANDKGREYVLTLADYTTRHPEASLFKASTSKQWGSTFGSVQQYRNTRGSVK